MKQSKFLEITVPVPHYTSARKAGVTRIILSHGKKVLVLGNLFAPDNDPLFEELVAYVSRFKPDVIICPGRMVHDHAFELMAPGATTSDKSESEASLAPEVIQALEHSEMWEERVIKLGQLLGQNYFVRLVEAAGPQCEMFYIPALEGNRTKLPPESNIKDILERIQNRINADRRMVAAAQKQPFDPGDYPSIPMKRAQFGQLLGIDQHPQIHVFDGSWPIDDKGTRCPGFGSSIELHCQVGGADSKVFNVVRLEIGNRKVMHPITEAYNGAQLIGKSLITAYPGHLSVGWWSRVLNNGFYTRSSLMYAQIGMMFARERMDFGDGHLERYGTGFYAGYNWRGTLHGKPVGFLRGENGLRTCKVWGDTLAEGVPGGIGREHEIRIA